LASAKILSKISFAKSKSGHFQFAASKAGKSGRKSAKS